MQNPNEDTEWNDVLRAKGIIPPKEKELSETDIIGMVEQTIQEKTTGKDMSDMNLDELDELEDDILDEEEERLYEEYKRKRIMEMKAAQLKAKYEDVLEITKEDWVREINKADESVWVIVHVYKQGIPLCSLINQHIHNLARKFPETKFIKSISSSCIPNYPDKNLPTIFIYKSGELKKQYVGPITFGGMNFSQDELEWILKQNGAVTSTMEENPRKGVEDVMANSVRNARVDSDDDDW